MWSHHAASRAPRPTTMPCRQCRKPVEAKRTCFQVYLSCPACGAVFPVEDYIHCMDEALEDYLENVYCNRI